jgi:hypothetical protein
MPATATVDRDVLFPQPGSVSATVATGIPYVAIGEVSYGVTERFAVGVMGGVTPITYGIGLRARGIVAEGTAGRLAVVVPVLYYPATGSLGHEPWVLTLPQLLAERSFDNGALLHIGVGAAAAMCTEAIAGVLTGRHHEDGEEGFMGGFWNTATVGGALPLGFQTTAFLDATLIMKGFRMAGSDWIGGPPVVITLGLRRAF